MNQAHFISVILPLKLEWEPVYSAGGDICIGDRVRVTFANKEYVGAVSATDVAIDIDPSRILPVTAVEKGMGAILPQEIQLWKQVADYYMCTVGEVYKAAYPAGKINLEEAKAAAREKVIARREKIAADIERRISALQERLQKKELQYGKAKDNTIGKSRLAESVRKISEDIQRAEESLKAARKNIESATHGPDLGNASLPELKVSLTPAQEEANSMIAEGFRAGKPVLLNGVTGSGKTEIYILNAWKTLKAGKNVLYLVPEIALSRQLEDRLREHFGERLLIFHSGETAASKRNIGEMIRSQKGSEGNYILLGTRSSLFLPHHDLGLIIVDEEHDNSYKQDSPAPRYNGRDTALMLSQIQRGCHIILGSATPSLEEMYNCLTGKHVQVILADRFHGSSDAEVEIIDTKAERRKNGMIGSFSRRLIAAINETIGSGGQVLILRSRRAWATVLQCSSCGEIQKCPHCNVSQSLHKTTGKLTCHYCGRTQQYDGTCTSCGGSLVPLGAGTQKIEEEAARLFPDAGIARLDSDTSQNRKYERDTIQAFADGKIDILIGTQIITKGFDFGNLRLVAVIAADSLLGIQDFRADEKALQLLEQFRGRCGRRSESGKFVIQTSQPEHPVYTNLEKESAREFSLRLLEERKDFNFPPFSRIIEIALHDTQEKRVVAISLKLHSRLAEAVPPEMITGPYQPAIDKIEDEYIRKIRINLKKDRMSGEYKRRLRQVIAEIEKSCKYTGHISLNVDPS